MREKLQARLSAGRVMGLLFWGTTIELFEAGGQRAIIRDLDDPYSRSQRTACY